VRLQCRRFFLQRRHLQCKPPPARCARWRTELRCLQCAADNHASPQHRGATQRAAEPRRCNTRFAACELCMHPATKCGMRHATCDDRRVQTAPQLSGAHGTHGTGSTRSTLHTAGCHACVPLERTCLRSSASSASASAAGASLSSRGSAAVQRAASDDRPGSRRAAGMRRAARLQRPGARAHRTGALAEPMTNRRCAAARSFAQLAGFSVFALARCGLLHAAQPTWRRHRRDYSWKPGRLKSWKPGSAASANAA
jgi:hypothetical protein